MINVKSDINPLAILLLSITLSACSTNDKLAKKDNPITNNNLQVSKTESRQCVDNFDLLKRLNNNSFTKYRGQFDIINNSYNYYKKNEGLMENDPKEQMNLVLNDKLNMVCDRVKSQTFNEIRQKMKYVSQI